MNQAVSASKFAARRKRFYKNDVPKYVRCYDLGPEHFDRYTVIFTGAYRHRMTSGQFMYIGMNAAPFHPLGFGQHGFSDKQIDRPSYSHLGKKIKFDDLPPDCRTLAVRDYDDLWNLCSSEPSH